MIPIIQTPPPEIEITPDLVVNLITEQFPQLAHLKLTFLGEGWDNSMFRLGDQYLVRLPRRKKAVPLLKIEQEWLPKFNIPGKIKLPIPIGIGSPNNNYPWSWSILPWFDGQSADIDHPNADEAIHFANFLKTLHQPAPTNAPTNLYRGVPLSVRAADTEDRMSRLAKNTSVITTKIKRIWTDALETSFTQNNCWLHGDLHPRNIVVNNGEIQAVIDWGDLTSGDVATDLASCWMIFHQVEVRQQAIEVYAPSPMEAIRAKGWAVFFAVILLDTGLVDNPQHAKIGRQIFKNLQNSKD